MKFLHTSDLHLGKKLEGVDRLEEQKEVLDEIVDICKREKVDVVLVAGDVFDTFVPPAEAEKVFFDWATHLAEDDRKVVMISGNHDDALRLSASNPFAEKMGIFIAGGLDNNFTEVDSGKGYLIIEKANEKVFIGLLPYPNEARFKEEDSGEDYLEKMKRWLSVGINQNTENLPSILVGHFYTLGGAVSESERSIDLGGARSVSKEILPDCNYIALGHLHKRQVASKSKNAYYSGAILEYAFDEVGSQKSVNVFEINGGVTENFKQIPLKMGKRLVNLEANGFADALEVLQNYKDNYVKLTLFLDGPLSETETKTLKNEFPNVIKYCYEFSELKSFIKESRKALTDEQLFEGYYKQKYSKTPPKELITTFLEIINEAD